MPRLVTAIAFKWVSVLEKWDLEVYIVVHLCVTIFGMAVREVIVTCKVYNAKGLLNLWLVRTKLDVMVIVAKSLV